MILHEKEILEFLNIPSIPKKEWDGQKTFAKGVAIVKTRDGGEAYAACSFNDISKKEPTITKVFGIIQFTSIEKVFVCPDYMANVEDIKEMDLDEESKRNAETLLKEAEEIEKEDAVEENDNIENLPEWIFPEISNKQQAEAWLQRYNQKNGIKKGKIPQNEETIKLRLYSIYTQNKNK
jgi:hypothetical protein